MKGIIFTIFLNLMLPLYSLSNPTVTSVSFQLTRNLIIVEASVNGKEGLFILDTGVADIILNNRYFTGSPSGDKFYGVHGNEIDKETNFINFNLGGFESSVLAIVTDFTALEEITGLKLFGVVGNRLFKNCELVLDYTFRELTIYKLNKNGNRLFSKEIHRKPLDTLNFIISRGVPFIEVNANGILLKMSLDTGASANVIDRDEFSRMNSNSLKVSEASMASFGQNQISVNTLNVNDMKVGNLTCPAMKTIFVTLDPLNQNQWGMRVDGILGYEFLNNFRVAINFKKREVYLWDRESVELQWALANNVKGDTTITNYNRFWR